MVDNASVKGSCLCGSVQVEIPDVSNVLRKMTCHCIHCQKGAGGPFQTNAVFRTRDVKTVDKEGRVVEFEIQKTETHSGFPKEKWFCSVSGPFWLSLVIFWPRNPNLPNRFAAVLSSSSL